MEETANEARFGTLEDGRLYKILALVFGSLFVVSLFIIVFLMFYKSRRSPGNTTDSKRKSFADRTNSTNIISDKPISYMVRLDLFIALGILAHPFIPQLCLAQLS